MAAVIALVPVVQGFGPDANPSNVMNGPIAQVAVSQKDWDIRGFKPSDVNSMADEVTYQYAGHYIDKATGDRNPTNTMCSITLHANRGPKHPYGGEGGFVYVQSGTTRLAQGITLYNPTLDDIYTTRLNYEYVSAECWPGKQSLKYPHESAEYR